ncbi:MAG: DNA polymerase III subunit delta [Desulfovibrionales bacterium]|nr:MAG: DNA polymerase III subunit delta [Desulfovibrionales bacterium]
MLQREIQRRVRGAGCEDWSRTTYWADEPLDSGFWTSLAMPGLMSLLGKGRIVVLRRANALTVKVWSDLEPLLRKSKPDLWTFFCLEGEWKGKSPAVPAVLAKQPFFRAAQQRQWVWQSPGMTPQSLHAELKSWATRQGITFAPNVGERLAELLPLDGARFGNELQKLELALGDRRRLEVSDLGLLGEPTILDNFAFLRGILQSPTNLKVWQTVLLDKEAASSGMLMPVLGLLQREMRILWLLNAGEDGAVSLPPSFKSEKKRLAASMGEAGITRIIDCVFQAETDLKSGNKQADQILEFLVSSLSSTSGVRS